MHYPVGRILVTARNVMKRNEIISIFIWLLIGAILVLIFNIYPQTNTLSGGTALLILIVVVFYCFPFKRTIRNSGGLPLGRFKTGTLIIWIISLIFISFPVIFFIGKMVRNYSPHVKVLSIVIPTVLFSGLAGILGFAAIYRTIKRD